MSNKPSTFFSVMVVGDNPQKIMEKYSYDLKVEPYIKYKYELAQTYHQNAIDSLSEILKNQDTIGLPSWYTDGIKTRLSYIKSETPFEYYQTLTAGMHYTEDGDALSEQNPNGHWKTCHIGRNFAIPFILKDGSTSYSAIKENIDFDAMDNKDSDIYRRTWELVMENESLATAQDKQIYEAMKDKTRYLSRFHSKEKYVLYNTKYWAYAVVSDEHGWQDADTLYKGNVFTWIMNFRQNIVDKLPLESKVSIYECSSQLPLS